MRSVLFFGIAVLVTASAGSPAIGEPIKAKIVKGRGSNAVTVPNIGVINTDMAFDSAEWTPPRPGTVGSAKLWLSTKNERSGFEIVSWNKGVKLVNVFIGNDPKAALDNWSTMNPEGKNAKGNLVYSPREGVNGRPVQIDAKTSAYILLDLEIAALPAKK